MTNRTIADAYLEGFEAAVKMMEDRTEARRRLFVSLTQAEHISKYRAAWLINADEEATKALQSQLTALRIIRAGSEP